MLLAGGAHAEGNCPPGQYPIGAPQGQAGPQGCAPIPGYSNQGQNPAQPAPPQWADRWGAIASYVPKGILGTSSNLPNPEQAKQAAIMDCQAKGASTCKIEISYGNQCVAMIVGHPGYSIAVGPTANDAEQSGMKMCSDGGDTNCHVYYSACSLPIRNP
ncbi:MAG: DUF4189 domain-containing protein [Rhodanobacter sp.]